MFETWWIWGGIAAYVLLAVIAAVWSRAGASDTMSDYFLGNRGMGGFVSAMSYSATTFSAFMMIGLAGLAYAGGVGALGFELLYLCGVSLVAIFGPKFWRVGKKYGFVTPSEMIGSRYQSKGAGATTALASMIFLIPYAAVQLAGVGYLLSGMTDGAITFTTGAIIAVVLALVFSLVAGLRSVAWTDALQSILMIVSATAIVILVVWKLGGPGKFFADLSAQPGALEVPGEGFFSLPVFIGMTLPWIFFSISNPQVSQRLFTPATSRDMRTMLLGFMIFGLIYTLVAVVWGFATRIALPGLDSPDMASPTLLGSYLVPAPLALVVMIGILAACVSTIDSIMLTLSSMFSRDVFGPAFRRTGAAAEKAQLTVGKFVLPVIAGLAFWFAHLKIDLIAVLSVSASAGLLVIVPATIGAFYWKRGTAIGVISSVVIAGGLVLALEATQTKLFGQGSGVWGLSVAVLVYIVVSLLTSSNRTHASEFIATSKGEGPEPDPFLPHQSTDSVVEESPTTAEASNHV